MKRRTDWYPAVAASRQGGQAQSAPTPASLNFSQTINLAQNYLNKALDLSRNQNQSDEDKKAIVVSLAESLKQATNSISLAPNQPEGYFLRAQVLTAISKINPKAAGLAKQDLELAAKLASDKNIVLPPPVNPVDLLPDEQAGTPQNLIIASPAEAETKENQSNVSANANQKRFILPAGQTEMTIKDTLVKADSFIYLIPENNNNLLVTLASKEIGSFSVTVDAPAKNDIPVDYYIINE